MKKIFLAIALAASVLTLGACSKKMSGFDNGNVASFQLSQMDTIDKSMQTQGIEINNDSKATPGNMSEADLEQAHAQLAKYNSLALDVIEKVSVMSDSEAPNRAKILARARSNFDNANEWMAVIEKSQSDLKKASAKSSVSTKN